MSCSLNHCGEYDTCEPKPDSAIMAMRFTLLGLGILTALAGMVKHRKFKHLAAWMGEIAFFMTLPRYLICSRCDGYDKRCYSYYGGKYTAKLFPQVENKEPGISAAALEFACLGAINLTPFLALRGDRRLMARYISIMCMVLAAQLLHACRWCVASSDLEWKKKLCPVNRAMRKMI